MIVFFYIFLKFMFYSFIGYIMEVLFTFFRSHKLINRGFLFGPYCSIYGVAGLTLSIFNPQMNIITIFILSMLLSGLIEGITGFILDKIFKMRWWDYSNNFLNLNGYICLKFMLLFGLFSLVGVYFINPFFDYLYYLLDNSLIIIISISLIIIYLIDIIISNILLFKVKNEIPLKERNNTALIISKKKMLLLKMIR